MLNHNLSLRIIPIGFLWFLLKKLMIKSETFSVQQIARCGLIIEEILKRNQGKSLDKSSTLINACIRLNYVSVSLKTTVKMDGYISSNPTITNNVLN